MMYISKNMRGGKISQITKNDKYNQNFEEHHYRLCDDNEDLSIPRVHRPNRLVEPARGVQVNAE